MLKVFTEFIHDLVVLSLIESECTSKNVQWISIANILVSGLWQVPRRWSNIKRIRVLRSCRLPYSPQFPRNISGIQTVKVTLFLNSVASCLPRPFNFWLYHGKLFQSLPLIIRADGNSSMNIFFPVRSFNSIPLHFSSPFSTLPTITPSFYSLNILLSWSSMIARSCGLIHDPITAARRVLFEHRLGLQDILLGRRGPSLVYSSSTVRSI